jgi:hypothetical protein
MRASVQARCPILSDKRTWQQPFHGCSYNARAGSHRDRIARPIWPTRGAICDKPNNGRRIAGSEFCPDRGFPARSTLLTSNAITMPLTRPVLQARPFRFIRFHTPLASICPTVKYIASVLFYNCDLRSDGWWHYVLQHCWGAATLIKYLRTFVHSAALSFRRRVGSSAQIG